MKRTSAIFLSLVLSIVVMLVMAGGASASPGTLQDFQVSLTSSKAGTGKKPAWVGVNLRPFHRDSTLSGNANVGWNATGAFLETPPFATKYATIYFSKYIKFNNSKFPTCPLKTVLESPDSCPKLSEIGRGGKEIKGSDGSLAKKDYALGGARAINSGDYVLATELTVRNFNLGNNKIALRVYNTLINQNVMDGTLSTKLTSAEKKAGYGSKLRIDIPQGLVESLPGIVSQLSDFNSGLRKVTVKKSGKTYGFAGLTGCPKNKTLNFGYQGEYNVNAEKNASGYVIGAKSELIKRTVKCK